MLKNGIKNKINTYYDFIATYLKNNLFPECAKYLVFLEESIKKYLKTTNNKMENYIGNILSKAKKKILEHLMEYSATFSTEKRDRSQKDWPKKMKIKMQYNYSNLKINYS